MPPPEALQLPLTRRAAFLEQACSGDEKLRQRIEGLLQIHDQADDFLEHPPSEMPRDDGLKPFVGEKVVDRIGRYKLLQQIGEGGCGVDYMAEREEPVHRRVALKRAAPFGNCALPRWKARKNSLKLSRV